MQEEQKDKDQLRFELAEIDQELTLYNPDGPWRFLEGRLNTLLENSLAALTSCNMDEVPRYRERFMLVRHLLNLPEDLREARARLQEQLNDE